MKLKRSASERAKQVLVFGSLGVLAWVMGCAKSDLSAPAKEAPSGAPAAGYQAQSPEEVAEPPPAALPSPVAPGGDQWPQAEAVPAPPADGLEGSKERPEERELKRKSDQSPARVAAPAPKSTSAGGASMGDKGEADDARPALALSRSLEQLNVAFGQFEAAIDLSVPDCSAAERFRQNVCTLADHICTLEQDLPSTAPRKCADGKKRCTDASSRYHSKCDK